MKLSKECANCGKVKCYCTRNGEVEGLFKIIDEKTAEVERLRLELDTATSLVKAKESNKERVREERDKALVEVERLQEGLASEKAAVGRLVDVRQSLRAEHAHQVSSYECHLANAGGERDEALAEVERLRASNKEKNRHLQHSAEVLRTSTEATVRHLNEIARLRALAEETVKFLSNVHDNYDCDSDGHKYDAGCRSCEAGDLLVKWAGEASPQRGQ